MLVLAHELGHGIHSLYADKQSISAQEASLPLADEYLKETDKI